MYFVNNNFRRSGFEIFMDCLCVLYDYKVLKIDELVRKANLGSVWRDQIVDFLLVNNYCTLVENNLLVITDLTYSQIGVLVPYYKKSKELYVKSFKGDII